MESVNYNPRLLRHVVAEGLLGNDAFVCVDIGCALGIDPVWRLFGSYLRVFAFDPQVEEIERLRQQENDANVRYFANFIGLPEDHAYFDAVRSDTTNLYRYYDPFLRSSAFPALAQKHAHEQDSQSDIARTATETWASRDHHVETISLDEFAVRENIADIDFVKSDTDGSDFQVVMSCERTMRERNVLGFLVETPYHGSYSDTANSFHNVDRFMKKHGYLLYGMSQNRYTRAALPGVFVYDQPYQTVTGQPMWGDTLYLRDGAAQDYEAIWGEPMSTSKLLKLLCLYEVFCLPDCAAELISVRRAELARVTDPDLLLDLLTPALGGRRVSYREYLDAFSSDYTILCPSRVEAPDPQAADAGDEAPDALQRLELENARLRAECQSIETRATALELEGAKARQERDEAVDELKRLRATRVWRWGSRLSRAKYKVTQTLARK